jgi:hypothetical protein
MTTHTAPQRGNVRIQTFTGRLPVRHGERQPLATLH